MFFLVLISAAVPARGEDSWRVTRPDTLGDVGEECSLALDTLGRPSASYFEFDLKDLKYAERVAGAWTTTTVDSAGMVGWPTSLALDSGANPHIAYYDLGARRLKYATRSGGLWTIEVVDQSVAAGRYLALALDPAGNPHIAYFDSSNYDLRYASRTGTSWTVGPVPVSGNVGTDVSLAIDASWISHITYRNDGSGDLQYARRAGGSWSHGVIDTAGNVGFYSSVAVDGSGVVHVAYYDATHGDLRYASGNPGSWSRELVDSTGVAGTHCSIALDSGGRPHVSYRRRAAASSNGDVCHAVRGGPAWTTSVVDTTGDVGWYSSIRIGREERPRIAYYDNTRYDLVLAELLPDGIVVNEFVVRPRAGRAEFFELHNASSSQAYLGRWRFSAIRWDGSVRRDYFFPPAAFIVPGGFYADSSLGVPDFFFDEGASLLLLDPAGSLLDRVGYGVSGGAPISCPLYVPPGGAPPPPFDGVAGELLSPASAGDTLATSTGRAPDGSDSDDDGSDFSVGPPTPDSSNSLAAPDLANGLRLNGAYVFPQNQDPDPQNEAVEFMNPLAAPRDLGSVYLSDGFLIRPVFPAGTYFPLAGGSKFMVQDGVNGDIALELEHEDRLDLYELREAGLVRVDQLGWTQLPAYFPDSALSRVPDGAGPSGGWDWNTSGGYVTLFYVPSAPFKVTPPQIGVEHPAGPHAPRLEALRPNPARGAIEIRFQLAGWASSSQRVEVGVFDVTGRLVARAPLGRLPAGPHRVSWTPRTAYGSPLASGVYYLRLSADGIPLGDARRVVWLR